MSEIGETDKVIHTVETDMVKLVVEIKCFGKSFDEFDKETESSDGLQPMQADPNFVSMALIRTSFCMKFMLSPNKHKLIKEWRAPPQGCSLTEFSSLLSISGDVNLDMNGDDIWSWDNDASGSFKVKTLTCGLQDILLSDHSIGPHHMWNSWIPRKINICVWRASIDRLPTRTNLISRGVNITSTGCPFCHNEDEYIDHCLIRCPRVITIWRKVWSWWQLDTPVSFPSFSISDISLGTFTNLGCPKLNKVIYGVFQCGLWVIWKWRNKIVHASPDSGDKILKEDVFSSIQSMNTPKDGFDSVHGKTGNGGTKPFSFAFIFMDNTPKKTVQLSELSNKGSVEGADVAIPLVVVDEVSFKKALVDSLVMAIPFQNGPGHSMETIGI
ncbi:RNA-directed DNA polymerase, eukaryota, reverse transcriptase zinc-binding domain protein [Tanacetum coccineum]